MDMWEPYRDLAHQYFKHAEVAVDPLHAVEHLTLGFTRLRVDFMNQAPYHSPAYYLLKHWRVEIINSFHHPYENRKQSNALTESLNEKIRELIDIDRFRARALYCLNPSLFYSLTSMLSSRRQEGRKRSHYHKPKS